MVDSTCFGVVGNKLLSGEKRTIAWSNNRINATDIQVGCQENKSDPGLDKYTIKPVKATDRICTTILCLFLRYSYFLTITINFEGEFQFCIIIETDVTVL